MNRVYMREWIVCAWVCVCARMHVLWNSKVNLPMGPSNFELKQIQCPSTTDDVIDTFIK